MESPALFPPLPLHNWEATKSTLHLYAQVIGKIRLALVPHQNHWWHVPLYVNTRGIGTRPIPYDNILFEINIDFLDHKLIVTTNTDEEDFFYLYDGLSVSDFYQQLFRILSVYDIKPRINARPYDLSTDTPFREDSMHHAYDKEYVEYYWRILQQVDHIFRIFNQDFYGKICPIQLYWHSFDLVVTRFSGRLAPPMPNAGKVDKEAYSHEVISFGFWPGDEEMREAAFYSYTFPAPDGLNSEPLKPAEAFWMIQNGSPMALLKYNDLRVANNPQQTLLDFLESAYQAGIKRANWDTASLHKSPAIK